MVDISSYGSEYVFNSAESSWTSVALLDSTHIVVAFQDGGDGDKGKAVVGVISSGDQIAWGSEYQFNAANTQRIAVSALDSTHFVVVFEDVGGANHGIAMIGVVSNGDEIAYGAEYAYNTANVNYSSVAALDSTHFVVAFDDTDSSEGVAMIGVVSSGDQIAFGVEYDFNAAVTEYSAVAKIDSTHFVVAFKDDGGDDYGYGIIGTVSSGDNIAYGSEYEFNAANTTHISVALLDSTHFVVVFRDSTDLDYYGTAIIGVISSVDNIAFGSKYDYNTASTDYQSVAMLNATNFVVSFADQGNSGAGTGIIGTVSNGDEIGYGAENVYNAGDTRFLSIVNVDSTHFATTYRDLANSSYGTGIMGTYELPAEGGTGKMFAMF